MEQPDYNMAKRRKVKPHRHNANNNNCKKNHRKRKSNDSLTYTSHSKKTHGDIQKALDNKNKNESRDELYDKIHVASTSGYVKLSHKPGTFMIYQT